METIIEEWLMKKYEGVICRVSREKKEDLKLVSGHHHPKLVLIFIDLSPIISWVIVVFIYNLCSVTSRICSPFAEIFFLSP